MIEFLIGILRETSHWIEGFATGEWEWVIAVLAAVAFTESIVSPFPPDPVLIAAAVFNPDMALVFAAVTTAASVLGAVAGHWLGKRFGRPLLDRFVSADKIKRVEDMFGKYGAWAIVFAAVTPVPYKVFAVTAGAMDMPLRPFIIASVIGRGARMFIWAILAMIFGEDIVALIETQGTLWGIALGVAVIVAFALYLVIMRLRRRSAAKAA